MTARGPSEPPQRPEAGDILLVIHDFQARSSDELSLIKGDRVELLERDDEFGDGWFFGKHLTNGSSGLFPEVYTRPAPKGASAGMASLYSANKHPATATTEAVPIQPPAAAQPSPGVVDRAANPTIPEEAETTTEPARASVPTLAPAPTPAASAPATASMPSDPPSSVTLPLSSTKSSSFSGTPTSITAAGKAGFGRLNSSQDSQVLNDTLNVINEHITDLRSPQSSGSHLPAATDSGSEYSSHLGHRLSYIQGEETDDEEDGTHTRAEVVAWSADDVAEYLFTAGVDKQHCETFRDQEISGEVLLGMDQTQLFIKAFDLGSVGRRLKTWQKIKALQDEVSGQGLATRRTTQTYGSDVGSTDGRTRSRSNTVTSASHRLPAVQSRPTSTQTKRLSTSQTPRMEPTQVITPVSPTALADGPNRPLHEKRPSAASVRDLHHSRRHSSNDFRLTGTTLNTASTPKLAASGSFPQPDTPHKKQPSFDRNWTMGNASSYNSRPLSSAGFQELAATANPDLQDSAVDLDRGYFSGTDADGKRRNVLKKRDGSYGGHSRETSYTNEQRVRSGTALSRHSRFGSVDSVRDPAAGASPAAQKYYGMASANPRRRTASTSTPDVTRPLTHTATDTPSPTVTRLDGSALDGRTTPLSPMSPANRQAVHADWFAKPGTKPSSTVGLRAISDAVTGNERSRLGTSPIDSSLKESPLQSPSRAGSSTPSAGPSFELDSPDTGKGTNILVPASRPNIARKKNKQETSAYMRGLQKASPRQAIAEADYSGWMKKRSSNLMTTWKPRLFVLRGRRLAYYYSEDDTQEKGLIDISFHRVLPADNERLTGLHATLTGASNKPTTPANSHVTTLAEVDAARDPTKESESMFIFKLVPPRTGLSRAVTFTKPTIHYFAVPNIKQGRLWMAALMKATIDRDDTQPITTTYQQKTISLAKARAMRHRPPALMNLDEKGEEIPADAITKDAIKRDANGLGIVYGEGDSGVSGLEKLGLQKVESARTRRFPFETDASTQVPQSA